MIKAGTPKERVAEILQASGVQASDTLVYLDYAERYETSWLCINDITNGFVPPLDYLYALRLEKDGPRKIELVEPKTVREKMGDAVRTELGIAFFCGEVPSILSICAKVAEEHFRK